MQATRAPRKRCAICVGDGTQVILLALPRPPKAPAPAQLEPLMFFDEPPPTSAPSSGNIRVAETNKWAGGWFVAPFVVNGNGEIRRYRAAGETEFSSFQEAFDACGPFTSIAEYPAAFGCILLDTLYLLVASRVEEAAPLPFGGAIFRVTATEWVPLDIPGAAPPSLSPADRRRLNAFRQYSYEGGYFYSDDCDLTRPFPFVPPERDEGPEFCSDWSEHLRQPFRLLGIADGCSTLLRGFAESKIVELRERSVLHMLLLGRQNNLNPGPRYFGRGLNGKNAVGNDYVYEYVMWKPNEEDGSISFARHTILRGTVPVRWSTKIHASVTEPSMIFSPNREDVLRGCDTYFETVFRRLAALIKYDAGNEFPDAVPGLRCINLLRQNPQCDEARLSGYFVETVRRSDAAVQRLSPTARLELVHVDWIDLMRRVGFDVVVKEVWGAALTFLALENGEAVATVSSVRPDGSVTRKFLQTRFVRINCADSLDRTNLGCFFTCFQVSVFMLKSLGIGLDNFVDQKPLPPLDGHKAPGSDAHPASPTASSGTKRTFCEPFVNSWCDARNPFLSPVAVARVLAELHVHNGDTVAQLYTGSAAMHSNLLRGLCGLKSTASNTVIATQRRFENVFEDKKKFMCIELLLGRNKDIHFRSMSQVFLTRPVPMEHWKYALLAWGVPPGVTACELEKAVRKAWDEIILCLSQTGQLPNIASTALCFEITMAKDEVEAHTEFATAVGQVTFEQTSPTTDDDANVLQANVQMGVIEFDHDLCDAIDVARVLRQNAVLKIHNINVSLFPYAYPVRTAEEDSVGSVQKVTSSLRSGLKNFVRRLNT